MADQTTARHLLRVVGVPDDLLLRSYLDFKGLTEIIPATSSQRTLACLRRIHVHSYGNRSAYLGIWTWCVLRRLLVSGRGQLHLCLD